MRSHSMSSCRNNGKNGSGFLDRLTNRPFLQILPLLAFLLVVFIIPVFAILILSIYKDDGTLTFDNFLQLFSQSIYLDVLLRTIYTAVWATIVCLTLGYPFAFTLAKIKASFRNVLLVAVFVPLWTSFLIRSLSLIIVFGRRGVINSMGQDLGLIEKPLAFLYHWGGVQIGLVHSLLPLSIITMYSVMQGIEPNLQRAAATMGARPSHGFWRIYLPLSLPGVAAGGILTFVSAMGFFITPQLLGGPRDTMIAQLIIQQIDELLNWNFGAAIAVTLLATTIISFFIFDQIVGMQILTGESDGRKRSQLSRVLQVVGMKIVNGISWLTAWSGLAFERLFRIKTRISNDRGRPVLITLCVIVAAFLSLPIFFIIPISFSEKTLFAWPPRGFSLHWYQVVLSSDIWMSAAWRSFAVALVTSMLAVLMAVPAALFLVRQKMRGKSLVILLLTIPIFLPHIITAIALFYAYSRIGLVGTWIGLILGHLVFCLPYTTISLMAVLKDYNRIYDQAAWTLGASKLSTFRRITLPIIKPGIYSAFLFAFIQSFDEVTVSLFVTGGPFATIPKQLYQQAMFGQSPELAAVSTLLLLVVCSMIAIAGALRRKG